MYIDYYGLTAPPFQLTPDARFWFESRTHRKAMAYLSYGLAQGEGFIAITGEIGAGKTTLVANLLARIDRARLSAIQIVSTQVEGDDVLRLVAQGLGLNTDGTAKALLLERVEQRLEEDYRTGKRTLVIVDEAQNLPVSALEELRMLSNFQLAGRALVQIILLAQPEFRDKIAGAGLEQLRQRVIATHHLDAMGEDEIEAYVRHRLGLAGWDGRPQFGAGVFGALHHYSDGIPRRLNQLLNRLLLHGAVEQLATIDLDAVEAVARDLGLAEGPAPQPQAQAQPHPTFVADELEVESPSAVIDEQPDIAEPIEERAQVLPIRPRFVATAELVPAPDAERHAPAVDIATLTRIAALESRVEEQEATLRRVLTLLIDYVERDVARPAGGADRRMSAA